jgi:isopentenyl-diphosphate delta-isomerase
MELVVLVDEQNNELGTRDKSEVHSNHTPLHRGLSLFLFNGKNELLLTRRAHTKKTFPGLWTNTVCGHPGPDEGVVDAARRRLNSELGIRNSDIRDLREVAPYRYQFADANGIVENEICPILVAHGDVTPKPNTREVASWKWISWKDFLHEIELNPKSYSPWSVEEAKIINSLHILDG